MELHLAEVNDNFRTMQFSKNTYVEPAVPTSFASLSLNLSLLAFCKTFAKGPPPSFLFSGVTPGSVCSFVPALGSPQPCNLRPSRGAKLLQLLQCLPTCIRAQSQAPQPSRPLSSQRLRLSQLSRPSINILCWNVRGLNTPARGVRSSTRLLF